MLPTRLHNDTKAFKQTQKSLKVKSIPALIEVNEIIWQ